MATIAADDFNEAGPVNLDSHTPSGGGTWTKNTSFSASNAAVESNRLHNAFSSVVNAYYHSAVPTNADYSVLANVVQKSDNGDSAVGVCGRMSTSASTGYMALYNTIDNTWFLRKEVAGSAASLGTASAALTLDQVYAVELRMSGTSISLYVDTVLTVGPITDSDISTAGKAGVWMYGVASATVGINLDSWSATEAGAGGTTKPMYAYQQQ
jgi:hypothetical protein